MSVSAAMVKELRSKTGAGIMDAKKALVETDGEIEAAIDWLRSKGIAKAANKSGRATSEGQVGAVVEDGVGALVEVNCETDFVARNSSFCDFVRHVANAAIKCEDLEGLLACADDGEGNVADMLAAQIATLGENMAISRMTKVSGGKVAVYIHNQAEPGVGKIGSLVAFEGSENEFGRQVAMHVAASNPIALSEADVPADRVARERQVLAEIAKSTGKPAAIIEKIVDGGLRKFYQTETLLNQKFIMKPEQTVQQAAEQAGVKIASFALMKVGEPAV